MTSSAGEEFVKVHLTPEAYAHGLALALPEQVIVPALPTCGGPRRGSNMTLARLTGVERAGTHPGFKVIPIEGTEEWRVADRDSA